MAIQILIADDHFVVRQGVRQMIGLFPDMEVLGEATNGDDVMRWLAGYEPDLLLLDMTMPGVNGRELIAAIRARHPQLRMLVLSMHRDSQVAFGALRAGANGYLTKDSEPVVLAEAIRKVAAGKRYLLPEMAEEMVFDSLSSQESRLNVLSPREREILEMIVAGDSMIRIAEKLHVSAKTVSTHKMRLMQKLNISSNAELILYANAEGIPGRGDDWPA